MRFQDVLNASGKGMMGQVALSCTVSVLQMQPRFMVAKEMSSHDKNYNSNGLFITFSLC